MSEGSYIVCDHCGALVDTDIRQPENASNAELEDWWDNMSEHWCPVYGEFRQIMIRGHEPCEV